MVCPFISISKLWKIAEGIQHSRRRHRQLQFIKLYKTNGELCFSLSTKRYKYFFFSLFWKTKKRRYYTFNGNLFIFTYAMVPAARSLEYTTIFEMAWRKLNVVSDNCHIHIYRHHMLLFGVFMCVFLCFCMLWFMCARDI